ncbi:hypothetical protein [Corynebacterium sp. MSK039]|uniref:hypothetical protein n=1 Tax=Corynebacterium sp. MSK039 TaxID=3050193 RepID=UPI00254E0649|nr:hypothetical protein [Corynebacterium sp. MSK039]MDK8791504.1 hypothetical protein [Corynebacterium sp. MSK039]
MTTSRILPCWINHWLRLASLTVVVPSPGCEASVDLPDPRLAIIKTIAFAPVTTRLEAYGNTTSLNSGANEPKHVFFSFGATKVYGMKPGRSSPAPESVISTMMLKRFIASSGIPSQTIRP